MSLVLLLHFSLLAFCKCENCAWRMLQDLNITHCGWDSNNPPARYGNEVSGFEGVFNFTDELHLIHGKYDIKYIVRKDNGIIGETLQELGVWEGSFQYKILGILEKLNRTEGSLYIDVGSNIGTWSLFMSRVVGSQGSVLSFEPQSDLVAQHYTSLLLNNLKNNQIINAFISNNDGYEIVGTIPAADAIGRLKCNYGNQNINDMKRFSEHDAIRKYSIPKLQLDHLYYRDKAISKCPAFIKLDIETFEVHAILGGVKMLRECMPVLFIEAECIYLLRSLFSILDHLGYALAWIFSSGIDTNDSFNGRKVNLFPEGISVEDQILSMNILFSSRNIIAVPRSYSEILLSQDHFIIIDINAEKKLNLDTWHDLEQHNKLICAENVSIDKNKFCIKWTHEKNYKYDSEKNRYTCVDNVLDTDIVNYFKKYR